METSSEISISKKYNIVRHYKILERLGGGGMGEVYRAEDIKLKREVALKFLPSHFSRNVDAKIRFIREAQTASSIDHQNICTIHEIDETDEGRIFIAMSFYPGETLKKRISSRVLKKTEALDIAIQICRGLAKTHQKNIIHRDIKPANIILTFDGTAKIVDFGLAMLAIESKQEKYGDTLGTISYISPEQLEGRKTDRRSDIWSLGITLHEMLTGDLPFKGEIDQAVIYSILNEAPELSEDRLSDRLKRIILKTLEKDTDDRYRNAEELISDLESALNIESAVEIEKTGLSIAVLPFTNMTNDAGQEYFCDGIAEEIINALTTVRELRVIARASSFLFKGKQIEIREIGRKLNVDTILDGSVKKSNGRLRITAQLINVSDGCHIWSEKFDRKLNDVFAIQDDISLSVVDKFRIKLMKDEKKKLTMHGTDNLDAYNFYLLGRYYYAKNSKGDLEKAIEYFTKAADKDCKYIFPYYGMVACYAILGLYAHSADESVETKAKQAVDKAVGIDPDSVFTLLAISLYYLCFTWEWEAAKKVLEKVREIDPENSVMHSIISGYYAYTGDIKNAILEEELAQINDPLRIESIIRLGVYNVRARQPERAREHLLKAKELEPDYYFIYWMLGQTYMLEKKFGKGIELIKKALNLSGGHPPALAALGWAYAAAGNMNEAKKILARLKERAKREHLNPFLFVFLYSSINDLDNAFKWLDTAYEQRDNALHHIITSETIDNLRKDPRYFDMLKKLGIYKYYKIFEKNIDLEG